MAEPPEHLFSVCYRSIKFLKVFSRMQFKTDLHIWVKMVSVFLGLEVKKMGQHCMAVVSQCY